MKSKVLYIRAEPELVKAVDGLAKDLRKGSYKGVALSRSDVIRAVLWAAVKNQQFIKGKIK